MGRYESQRAIAARTIYDRRRGRKRQKWAGWALIRLAALAAVTAAIAGAAWFAPRFGAQPAPAPILADTAAAPKEGYFLKYGGEIAPFAPAPAPRRIVHGHVAPADGAAPAPTEFEILTAEEMDHISQAR